MGGNSASTFGPPTRVAPRSRPRLRGFHPSIHTRAARLRRPIPAASSIVTHPKSPRRGGPAHPTPPRWRGRRRLSRSRVKEKALQKECGPGARQEASCSRPCTPRPDTCARPRSSDVTSTGHWARQAPQDVVVGGVAWACLRLVLAVRASSVRVPDGVGSGDAACIYVVASLRTSSSSSSITVPRQRQGDARRQAVIRARRWSRRVEVVELSC